MLYSFTKNRQTPTRVMDVRKFFVERDNSWIPLGCFEYSRTLPRIKRAIRL